MRERYRHYPDWYDECPGWTTRVKQINSLNRVISDTISVGHVINADRGSSPKGLEFTRDENHISELKDFRHFQFSGDIGGEFLLERSGIVSDCYTQHVHGELKNFPSSGITTVEDYDGPLFATAPANLTVPVWSPRDLNPIGTTAIARVKPTNNVANLATDLVEVRQEGLPHLWGASLWKDKTLTAKSAGGEYLNNEFGWKPLVSDIRGASYAAANAHKILKSYEANSHKIVRRRYEFPVEKTESWSIAQTGIRPWYNTRSVPTPGIIDGAMPTGSVYRCDRFYRRTWFSGAFTYHLPIGFNSRYKLIRAASRAGPLLGIELTPEVVWNATPWTWALDWFSNVGDCISIYSDMAVDGLVIKWGYVMEHEVHSTSYYWGNPTGGYKASVPAPCIVTAFMERKRRTKATPFGFGLSWSGFSPRQLAIAAALGLTRVF